MSERQRESLCWQHLENGYAYDRKADLGPPRGGLNSNQDSSNAEPFRSRGYIDELVGKIGGPMDVTLKVNGKVVAEGRVPAAMSLHFTGGNETFDIGSDLGSLVSLDYFDQAPFKFSGTIGATKISYPKK